MGVSGKENESKPVSVFSLILLVLMVVVIVFLVLVQNIDQFSEFFGGTAFKIIFDVALILGVSLFAVYIFTRSSEYNRRLEAMVRRLQKSNMLLQTLNGIQEYANASLDAQGLLEGSLEAVMPLTSSLGTIYILDDETSRFKPRARYGTDTPLSEMPDFGAGEGIVGMVAQQGEPVEDTGEGPPRGTGMVRYAHPIKSANRVVGVMVAGTAKGGYAEEEKTLFQAVSEVLGNSLTNARLYSLTRRALETTRKSQGYLESFVHEAHMGVVVLDEQGTVMIVNREAEEFLGAQRRDLLGGNGTEVFESLGVPGRRMSEGFRDCYREQRRTQFEQPVYDNPAAQIMTVNIFPLFREKGEMIGAAATISGS